MVLYIIKYTNFDKHFYWYIFTIFNNTVYLSNVNYYSAIHLCFVVLHVQCSFILNKLYIHIKMFCTWAHWKRCWLLKFRWYRCKTLFCSEFYVTSYIIHLTQYIDTTYSVKQMCASVLLKLKHKTVLWNKVHYANKTIRLKEANGCMNTHLFSKSNMISKIIMPVLLTWYFLSSWSRNIHNFQGKI